MPPPSIAYTNQPPRLGHVDQRIAKLMRKATVSSIHLAHENKQLYIYKSWNNFHIAIKSPVDWTKSVRRRESESFFCLLIRLLPGTGLACSALGEALPLSCQRFWAAKVLKRKEKIPKLDLWKAVTITNLTSILQNKTRFYLLWLLLWDPYRYCQI